MEHRRVGGMPGFRYHSKGLGEKQLKTKQLQMAILFYWSAVGPLGGGLRGTVAPFRTISRPVLPLPPIAKAFFAPVGSE